MLQSRPLVLALLAVAASLAACMGDPSDGVPDGAQPIEMRPVPGATDTHFFSGIMTRERLVIRDAATWAATWQQIVGTTQPAPSVPKIDFERSVVIVAAMGEQNSGGFTIDVSQVSTVAENAWVTVTERSPGARCVVASVLTAPVAVVVTQRFAGKAIFVERTATNDCD